MRVYVMCKYRKFLRLLQEKIKKNDKKDEKNTKLIKQNERLLSKTL